MPSMNIENVMVKNLFSLNNPDKFEILKSELNCQLMIENTVKTPINCMMYVIK